MFEIGDKVKAKAVNDEAFIGTVIALDKFGFAYVSFNGISEARILISELEKKTDKEENPLWDVLYHHQEQFTETAGVDGQEKENEMHQLFIDIIREAIDKAEKEANQMKCDLCETTEKLLTESDKATLRPNWAGVDFYNAICIPCWNAQKDIR